VNDFVRETARYYPNLDEKLIRIVVVHPGDYLLPELGEELGRYAERKLRERKVEVIKGARVASYDGSFVKLSNGTSIPAATLIWTAGVKPSAVIDLLPCDKERGRICVNEYFQAPGYTGLWAAGDCAAVPDSTTGKFYPPTAQHGLREGLVAAKNIERTILAQPLQPFRFQTLGLFVAWWFWRSIYLMKLPRLAKKLRVVIAWTLDLLFGRDIEQMITLRDVEEITDRVARIREQVRQQPSPAKSALDTSA
jgi:NADH dehydrogenase